MTAEGYVETGCSGFTRRLDNGESIRATARSYNVHPNTIFWLTP